MLLVPESCATVGLLRFFVFFLLFSHSTTLNFGSSQPVDDIFGLSDTSFSAGLSF
jgi:hypothetical protein